MRCSCPELLTNFYAHVLVPKALQLKSSIQALILKITAMASAIFDKLTEAEKLRTEIKALKRTIAAQDKVMEKEREIFEKRIVAIDQAYMEKGKILEKHYLDRQQIIEAKAALQDLEFNNLKESLLSNYQNKVRLLDEEYAEKSISLEETYHLMMIEIGKRGLTTALNIVNSSGEKQI